MVPDLKRIIPLPAVFAASVILASCAGQVAPEGGPRDTVPPAIIGTSPDTNATGVRPLSITLEFSKYVDHRSLEESVFTSPYLGELKYDWSGKSVTLTYKGDLKENTTYVVTVGTDVADVRERNRMASSFVLAFSTGDSIDRGFINGRVFDEKADGVLIFGYSLSGRLPDTLDPSHSRPDYVTQTGKDGTFSLAHIALGPYRVFAVRDEYHNFVYDREIDQYGVASGDFLLTRQHPVLSDVWYRLTKEDTSRPFVSSVKAVDRYRITVRFSEPLDSASFTRSSFTVADTVTGRSLPLRLVYRDRFQPSLAGLFTEVPLDSPASYRLIVRGVADLSGNMIDPNARGESFEGTLGPDTLRPLMTFTDLKDSTRGVPIDRPIEIRFSDPVVPFSIPGTVVLTDSTKKRVALDARWTGPGSIALIPREPLAPKAWFAIRVTMDSVRGLTGKTYRDSIVALRFQTLDLRTMGSIAGSVEDVEGGKGEIFLTAASINTTPVYASTIKMAGPGPFSLERLPEGKYTISAFRDSAGIPAYGFGLPWPFKAADRFTVYRDTIRVRARWGVEGVLVKFR